MTSSGNPRRDGLRYCCLWLGAVPLPGDLMSPHDKVHRIGRIHTSNSMVYALGGLTLAAIIFTLVE